jgi:NADH:ubiquinone oxidoreductase subunit
MRHNRMIRASEIGEYVFCQRAWWLHHVVGEQPSDHEHRKRGIAQHRRHGRNVRMARWLLITSLAITCLAVILFAIR